jgi:hypothetical protein
MIVYDLRCGKDHGFEAWFRDSAAYDEQAAAGDVRCPVCGSRKVEKALMAPGLARSKKQGTATGESAKAAELRRSLTELRRQVETNCDYVGERFPEEARKIHYGETDPRGIYGESSDTEAKALEDEGIKVRRIPWLPHENS